MIDGQKVVTNNVTSIGNRRAGEFRDLSGGGERILPSRKDLTNLFDPFIRPGLPGIPPFWEHGIPVEKANDSWKAETRICK